VAFEKIISYLTGYVEILIRGSQPEKFINLVTGSGLYLWHIRRVAPGIVHAKIRAHGYLRIREMMRRSGCYVKIHRKHGWPFLRRKLAERRMFLIGALLFIGLIMYLSSLVLFVRIEGFEERHRDKLLESLRRAGLRPGMTRQELLSQKRRMEREMMLVTPEAVWLGISVKGVVAEIKAVPRKTPALAAGPSDLVAAVDGVVTKVVTIRGVPAVREGDTVARGDLLISGIRWHQDSETGAMVTEEVPAGGIVEARVWYDIEVIEPKIIWKPRLDRQQWTCYRLRWNGRWIPLFCFGKKPANNYFWERSVKRIYRGRNHGQGVELIKDSFREVSWRQVRRSPEEIKRAALAETVLKKKQLKNLTIERQMEAWTDEGEFVKLITTLETTQDIAMAVPRRKEF